MSAPNLCNPATPSDPAGYTGPVEHGASPVPHAAPTHPGAPQVPPGWITQWSQEHNSWYETSERHAIKRIANIPCSRYYVYTATGLTQWDYPAASAKQDPASTGPALASPSPNDQPVHEQQTYDHDPNGPPGPDGDRGLGKAALVVGGGILAAASFGPLGKKLGPKLSAFFGNKPQQQPSTQSQSYGSGYPPTSQSHSYGSGYAAAPQAHTYGAGYAASPQPPPAYYGQPQYAAGPMNAGAGHTNVAPSSGVQPLRIYAAMFADKDVTQILRSLVTPQQSVSLTGNTLVKQFGNPWPETERQAFSVLYQYGERPMEAFTAEFVPPQSWPNSKNYVFKLTLLPL